MCTVLQVDEHNGRVMHWIIQLICQVLSTFIEVSLEQDMFVDVDSKIQAYLCVIVGCMCGMLLAPFHGVVL